MTQSNFNPGPRALLLAALLSLASAGLSGCDREQGPLEEAGERADETIDAAQDRAEEAEEEAREAVDEARDAIDDDN